LTAKAITVAVPLIPCPSLSTFDVPVLIGSCNEIVDVYGQLAVAIGNIDHTMKIMNDQRQSDRLLYQRYFLDLMESDSVIHNKIDYYIDSKIEDLNRKSNQTDIKLDRLYYKIDSVQYHNDHWEDSIRRVRE